MLLGYYFSLWWLCSTWVNMFLIGHSSRISSTSSSSNSRSSSSSSSSRTDRWVHFQQNVGLRLFVHTWIVHGIDDCYQLTRTFGGFSAQCLSKLFLKEVTVLMLTTSLGRAFHAGCCYFNWVNVLGNWCIKIFYNKFCPIVSCCIIKVIIEEPSCTGSSEFIQVFKHFN